MRNRDIVLLSVILSLFLHSVFIASSRYFILPGMSEMKRISDNLFRLQKVEKEVESVDLFDKSKPAFKETKISEGIGKKDKELSDKMLLDKRPDNNDALEKKKKELMDDIEKKELVPDDKILDEEHLQTDENRSKLDAEPDKFSPLRQFMSKSIPQAREQGDVGTNLKHNAERRGFRWAVPTTGMLNIIKGGLSRNMRESGFFGEKVRIGDYEDISPFLEIDLFKYVDPESGEKYFKSVIKTKNADNLQVIPKEVIFLVDSSKSITGEKLSYVKDAVIEALWKMHPGDMFNVIAFRGDLVKFRDRPVEAGNLTLLAAEMFVKKLEAVGQTDVDSALLGIVDKPLEHNPSYIILVTDGRPTTGVVDSRRIIRELTRHNDMKRSIFSFGGGWRVNRYLLDFISYQNRGWSRFSDRKYQIKEEFDKLYGQINDPLLLNMRYNISNIDAKEVYPKYLPDFFKGRELVIYGRYTDEDEFSMQILGDIDGSTKEIVFRESFKDAEDGGAEIAKGWAFRKIYYLISQDTKSQGNTSEIRRQIDELSKKYNILTPYDIEQTG